MQILGLESLTYGVEDLAASRRFNEDFGLEPVEAGRSGAVLRTAEGATVVLRDKADSSLPPPVTPGPQLRATVWGVPSKQVLDEVGAELSKDRQVKLDADGTLRTIDPMGYGFGVRVTRLKPFVQEAPDVNALGRPARINKRHTFPERARVLHLGHVVFHVPKLQESFDFYVNRLKFRVSDSFKGQGYFIRCAGSHDHHNIFLFHRGDLAGLNHTSYAVRDIDEVCMGGQYLESKGWKSLTGPGRHHIGSNYFWYFHSPCGGMVEYYADMDYLTDEWVPREWEFRPDVVAAWDRGPGFH